MRGPKKRLTPFGKMVVKALADRDMSRAELAATVGTSPQYMSYILNGTRSGEKYLPAIIAALALDPKKAARAIAACRTEGRERSAGRIHRAGGGSGF